MFKIPDAVVISSLEKEWEIEGKKGLYYETQIRVGSEIYPMTSKVDLGTYEYQTVTLECELRAKTPKKGNPYTGLRIIGVQ